MALEKLRAWLKRTFSAELPPEEQAHKGRANTAQPFAERPMLGSNRTLDLGRHDGPLSNPSQPVRQMRPSDRSRFTEPAHRQRPSRHTHQPSRVVRPSPRSRVMDADAETPAHGVEAVDTAGGSGSQSDNRNSVWTDPSERSDSSSATSTDSGQSSSSGGSSTPSSGNESGGSSSSSTSGE